MWSKFGKYFNANYAARRVRMADVDKARLSGHLKHACKESE